MCWTETEVTFGAGLDQSTLDAYKIEKTIAYTHMPDGNYTNWSGKEGSQMALRQWEANASPPKGLLNAMSWFS